MKFLSMMNEQGTELFHLGRSVILPQCDVSGKDQILILSFIRTPPFHIPHFYRKFIGFERLLNYLSV